jgi:hypothetical protein
MTQRPARQVAPLRILSGGRTLISRAELARMAGCAPSTLACLYAARSKTSEAARILGYHGPATIRAYLSRYPGYFPAPDQVQRTRGGRERKLWRRCSIWAFAERLSRSLSYGSRARSAI